MAKDFGDVFDIQDMTDDDLQDLIVQQLEEHPGIDAGWIDVYVKDGFVTLAGAVGTDGEKQVAEKVLAEVLGVTSYANELTVSELHREELPEDILEARAREREIDDQLGGDTYQQSDTAAHLAEDIETQTDGTHDQTKAIQEGATYVPPDRPIADGYNSEEDH